MMADKIGASMCASQKQGKRSFSSVVSTPVRTNPSPIRKAQRNEAVNDDSATAEFITSTISEMLDTKLEQLMIRFDSMLTEKINALEMKFEKKIESMKKEIDELKEDYNTSLNHVEQNFTDKIASTWEYAVRNEQYSRKNNVRIFGVEEDPQENLEVKLINLAKEHLQVDIKPEDVEIVHRVGAVRRRADASGNQKPRAIIAKFVSNKTKMKLLTKRRNLKGKRLAITEDMAPDIAKRLKGLKEKPSVESAWFVNGKIRYKLQGDTRVKELRDWGDFLNMNVEQKINNQQSQVT